MADVANIFYVSGLCGRCNFENFLVTEIPEFCHEPKQQAAEWNRPPVFAFN